MSRPNRPYVAEFCPMPGYPAEGETYGWQRWIVVAWNVLFYAMLLGFTASLVASGRGAGVAALGVTMALLLGGWYTWWMLRGTSSFQSPDHVSATSLIRWYAVAPSLAMCLAQSTGLSNC